MTDTKVATRTEVYSKAARLARMALFVRMMFNSRLKAKKKTRFETKLLEILIKRTKLLLSVESNKF